ncbi:hypothetical protein MF271_19290 (plasmid) [Deinococcus sp. KNUC1210]|uniref:hypothetical protein n=1 Tax=Deinococcus sp. KNUC1210 TaxID=2917691 RepID=UPI001EF0277A|nr:hypothetical protein [Deinococcus sp. KNUC1210]ULH17336.1 hypothetical protein MF271_19290 [Deinococcus sp. KNUC1210]
MTFDVIGDQLTVTEGRLSSEDLRQAATSLSEFLGGNRSKKATEAAIVKALPALAPEIRGMNLAELLAVIALIIALFTFVEAQVVADAATEQNQEIADEATRQNQSNADRATQQMDALIQEVRKLRTQQKPDSGGTEQHQARSTEKQHDADSGDGQSETP